MIFICCLVVVLFALELLYFKLADKYNIIDKPNERSSHTQITLRGGGIIFPVAWLIYFFYSKFQLPYITLGVVLVSVVSFIDDVKPLNSKLRLLSHLTAFTLCFIELNLFPQLTWFGLMALYILCIGCINAINFMDGINGMTGLYALSIFIPLMYIQGGVYGLDRYHPLAYMILSVLVFGFFNFRKKAKCFAGDVGSISLGFIIIFNLLKQTFYFVPHNTTYIFTDGHPFHAWFILFLSLYGVDSILTIIQRLWQKENIFKPHRQHLYQYLANEMKWNHILVAGIYTTIQLGINFLLITRTINAIQGWILLGVLIVIYITIKYILHKRFFSS